MAGVSQTEIYDDNDGSRRDEIAFVAGQGPASASGPPNMFSAFYERLNEVRARADVLMIVNGFQSSGSYSTVRLHSPRIP